MSKFYKDNSENIVEIKPEGVEKKELAKNDYDKFVKNNVVIPYEPNNFDKYKFYDPRKSKRYEGIRL